MAKKLIATLTDAQLHRRRPEIAARTKSALARMRKLLPGAAELVYDKRNARAKRKIGLRQAVREP